MKRCLQSLLMVLFFSGINAQIPVFKKTNYTVPSGAYFVAPSGNDSNPGTQAQPWKTIANAISKSPAGATVVIRQGNYHESLLLGGGKNLTLQAYPNEEVWLDGSSVITGWVKDGARWRKDNWTYQFPPGSVDPNTMDPNYPCAPWPDMVFINGISQQQVDALSKVSSGTFYVNYNTQQLYIGSDPTGKTVIGATLAQAMDITGTGYTIRGLGFKYYANALDKYGMIKVNAGNNIFENNTIAWAATTAIGFFGSNCVARGNEVVYNGASGIGGYQCHGLLMEQNHLAYNNFEHFHKEWDASGSKLARVRNVIMRENISENNQGPGLWFDISCYNNTIVHNIVRNNNSVGIFYELSNIGIIASNLVYGNSSNGIMVSNSIDVKVYNNTLSRNKINIFVMDDSRVNDNTTEYAEGITWITKNVTLKNNIISNGNGTSSPMLWVRDYNSSPIKNASQMLTVSNYNGWHRTSSNTPANLVEWWNGSQANYYNSVNNFRTSTGNVYELNSISIDNQSVNPYFIDEANENFCLKPGSPAIAKGEPLPSDVASAVGKTAGVPVDMGAFLNCSSPCAGILAGSSSVKADCGMSNGSATVSASGGTAPYTYSWSTSPAQTSKTATGLAPGTYTVNINDKNGCPLSKTVNVEKNMCTGTSCLIQAAPVIDGQADPVWSSLVSYTLANTLGSVPSSSDLSGYYKIMWDNNYLYLLAVLKDDVKINDSPQAYEDDAIEVFIDGNNDKASSYDANDHQYIFRWNDNTVYELHGGSGMPNNPSGINFAQSNTADGYIMETRIAWSTIGTTASNGKNIGFDIHLNDDDDNGARDLKQTWETLADVSYSNPGLFGTITLTSAPCSATTSINEKFSSGINVYPNPFSSSFTVEISTEIILNDAVMKIYDLLGKEIKSISISNHETIVERAEFQSGIYFYYIINDNKTIGKGKLITH